MNASNDTAVITSAEKRVDDLRDLLESQAECGHPDTDETHRKLRRAERHLAALRSPWEPTR